MAKKTEPTNEERGLVTTPSMLPAAADFAAYAGMGAATVLTTERVMPVLQLLQSNSKALIKSHEKHVPGAAAGAFLNRSAGNELCERPVFVACARQQVYVEWVPIEKGGGKVGTFNLDDPRCTKLRQEQGFGKLKTPEGNEISETYYVYGYTLNEADGANAIPLPAVLVIKGGSITPYKQFFNTLRSYFLRDEQGNLVRDGQGKPINPPLFAHMLRLGSTAKNKNGNDFLVHKFEHLTGDIRTSMVPAHLLAIGKQIAEDVELGRAKVEDDDNEGEATTSEGTAAF